MEVEKFNEIISNIVESRLEPILLFNKYGKVDYWIYGPWLFNDERERIAYIEKGKVWSLERKYIAFIESDAIYELNGKVLFTFNNKRKMAKNTFEIPSVNKIPSKPNKFIKPSKLLKRKISQQTSSNIFSDFDSLLFIK